MQQLFCYSRCFARHTIWHKFPFKNGNTAAVLNTQSLLSNNTFPEYQHIRAVKRREQLLQLWKNSGRKAWASPRETGQCWVRNTKGYLTSTWNISKCRAVTLLWLQISFLYERTFPWTPSHNHQDSTCQNLTSNTGFLQTFSNIQRPYNCLSFPKATQWQQPIYRYHTVPQKLHFTWELLTLLCNPLSVIFVPF